MMKHLVVRINPEIEKNLPVGLKTGEDKFNFFMNLKGEYFRKQKGRETLKFKLLPSEEKAYFIKKHVGIGITETLKNFLMLKQPVYGAKNEWLALTRLTEYHLPVPKPYAFGEKGCNPIFQSSFIVMQAIEDSVSLEDVCRDWKKNPPDFIFKRALIKEVARISREMHKLGINHRDYYICHFLCDSQSDLHLIDLHRAQIREKVPFRWLCKDLAGLYFSSMDSGLTKRDIVYFLKEYFLMSWRDVLIHHDVLLKKVSQRALKLYKKECMK